MTHRSPHRLRRIEATDAGGELICLLTAEGAHDREAPIDRLLELGEFTLTATGYEVRLPAGDAPWMLASRFIEEEAACCASLALEIEERDGMVVVRATA